MKTIEELRKMDISKLQDELIDLKRAKFKVTFEVKNGQSSNMHEVRNLKAQVARVKTVMKELHNQPTKS